MRIRKGLQFDSPLAFPELGPREKFQTEADGRRIQSIDRLVQFDTEGIGDVKFSGFRNSDWGKVGLNLPVPGLVGMSEGIAGDLSPDAQVIKSGPGCPQADLDILQAFPVGKLRECCAGIPVPARKTDYLVIAVVVVSIDAFSELVCGNKVHQLSKDRFPGIHVLPPHSLMRELVTSGGKFSNRQMTSNVNYHQIL